MVLRLFVQSLDGEARKWFKSLAANSINTWEAMEEAFVKKWGDRRDHGDTLTEFNTLKKNHNEGVSEFIRRFNKLYFSLPAEMKPHQTAAKVVFVAAFDSEFGFSLIFASPAPLTTVRYCVPIHHRQGSNQISRFSWQIIEPVEA